MLDSAQYGGAFDVGTPNGEISNAESTSAQVPNQWKELQHFLVDSLQAHYTRHEHMLQMCLESLDYLKMHSRSKFVQTTSKHSGIMSSGQDLTIPSESSPNASVDGYTNGFVSGPCFSPAGLPHTGAADLAVIYDKLQNIADVLSDQKQMTSTEWVEEESDPAADDDVEMQSQVIASPTAHFNSEQERRADQSEGSVAETLFSKHSLATTTGVIKKTGSLDPNSAYWSLGMDPSVTPSSFRSDRNLNRTNRCLRQCVSWLDWWNQYTEPPRTGCLARFTESQYFESMCAMVIMSNALFTAYTTDWEIKNLGESAPIGIAVGEACYLCFYTFEMVMKMLVHRMFFFFGTDWQWNLFDLFLVVFSTYDQVLDKLIIEENEKGGMNYSFLRSFRVFKMAKILRAVRAMRFITNLRLMLNSILGSFISLFWSFVMLAFIFYIFSLIFVQGTITFLLDQDDRTDARYSNLYKFFGSVVRGMMSLIQATTGGEDWAIFYDTAVMTGHFNASVFIFFIAFFHISLLNVLTGIFVEHALKLARPDSFTLALEQRKRELIEAEELRHVCKHLDKCQRGIVSLESFTSEMVHGKLKAHLRVLGLDIKDPRKFFDVLQSISNGSEVDVDTFVRGCMKLKGYATAIDLQSLAFEIQVFGKSLQEFYKLVRGMTDNAANACRLVAEAAPGTGSKQSRKREASALRESLQSGLFPPFMFFPNTLQNNRRKIAI